MLSVHYDFIFEAFAPRIEAVPAHGGIQSYYRLRLGNRSAKPVLLIGRLHVAGAPRIEAVPAHGGIQSYYRLRLGEACLILSDDQCRQLLEVLGSRPALPVPEPECECVRTDVDMVDASRCEMHGG